MTLLVAYVSTAIVFLVIDMVGLRLLVLPVFNADAPQLFLDKPNLAAAATFYLAFIAGVIWFVSLPALKGDASIISVFLNGAALGAIAYGTYEFTNLATLKGWTAKMVSVDLIWGMALTGVCAAAGVMITRAVTGGAAGALQG
ncbi:MAG: DUF2177 family protein [Pseudomonadota bacterium]